MRRSCTCAFNRHTRERQASVTTHDLQHNFLTIYSQLSHDYLLAGRISGHNSSHQHRRHPVPRPPVRRCNLRNGRFFLHQHREPTSLPVQRDENVCGQHRSRPRPGSCRGRVPRSCCSLRHGCRRCVRIVRNAIAPTCMHPRVCVCVRACARVCTCVMCSSTAHFARDSYRRRSVGHCNGMWSRCLPGYMALANIWAVLAVHCMHALGFLSGVLHPCLRRPGPWRMSSQHWRHFRKWSSACARHVHGASSAATT